MATALRLPSAQPPPVPTLTLGTSARVAVPRPRPPARGDARATAVGLAVAFLLPALAMAAIIGPHIAGGDSGQWLMLSRAYRGLSVPDYRDPGAVPPAAPLALAGLIVLTGDPFLAHKIALAGAFGLLGVGSFLLGRELFGWLPGLVGALLVAGGQHFYIHLAAFGALPQLLAVGAYALALAAVARWARVPTRRNQAFIAIAALLGVASHAPTSAVVLPALAVAVLLVPVNRGPAAPRGRVRGTFRRLAPLVPAGAIFVVYAWLRRGTFDSYLSNEAAYYLKGLGFALGELLRARSTVLMLVLAAAVLGYILLRGLVAAGAGRWRGPVGAVGRAADAVWRAGRFGERESDSGREAMRGHVVAAAVLAAPAAALTLMMLGFHAARVGTDYQRIFPLLGLPALVGVGVIVPALDPRNLWPGRVTNEARALALAALLLFTTMGTVVAGEASGMGYYSVRSPDDLRDALAQVDATVPADGAVWAPIREGKWVEGITGRPALIELQSWAIFRPWEWERRTAADVLNTGSAWASNGAVGVMFQRHATVAPDNPEVRGYYKGELQPILKVHDEASRLRVRLPGALDVPLSSLGERSETARIEGDTSIVEQHAAGTVWTWSGEPVRVEVTRKAVVPRSVPVATLEVHVKVSGAPLEAATLALRPEGSWALTDGALGTPARLEMRRNAEPLPFTLQEGPPGMAHLAPVAGGVGDTGLDLTLTVVGGPAGPRSEAHGTLEIAVQPVGSPPDRMEAETAEQVLRDFRVTAALVPKAGEDRLHAAALALGFQPAYENASYTLYRREAAP